MTTDTRTTLALGSWSIGSTRAEDWVAAALDMANSVRIDYSDELVISGETDFDYLARWLRHYREHEACDGETFGAHYRQCPLVDDFPSEALAAAIDALQEYAPIYCYVGAHGADFGVWLDHDALERAVAESERGADGTVYNLEDDVIIDVNDHGNVSVYAIERGRPLLEVV